ADQVRDAALAALVQGDGITVFNSLSFDRPALISLPSEYRNGAVTSDGSAVPVQASDDDVLALVQVPACGAITLLPASSAPSVACACAVLADNGAMIENACIRAELNRNGEIVSFVDKSTGREFAAGPMNRLLAYKDVPRTFDAWDIDSNYILQPVDLNEPAEISVKEPEGLRAVLHVSRRIMNSVFEQDIELVADSSRLDFKTRVDWHELHRLLKVSFPVDVNANEGINEIQFGYMMRPTHRSRLYDSDRFEVCNQRYSALCDQHHGAAVLNDCKYGISMNGNAMELTLLRAAASPEMRADNGEHTFTYALTAWEGSFYESPVTEQAYDLNVPVQVVRGACPSFSAFRTDARNVFIDTVKPAEDGSGDIILRLYEARKADTVCSLHIGIPAAEVWLCDMLENRAEQLDMEDSKVRLQFGTFEIKTLRISRA
ncbi:MAG: alpha-mannosidase, partial [Clostridia bacterium]|nr:alpha-mannosidase [Clostridia bacterium]